MKEYSIGTKCVQAGYAAGNGEPRQIPIIQSTTFKYDTSEDMGKLFDLEAEGYFYSRLQNPTCDTVARKIAAMEGGTAAMLTSSGQAANFYAMFNICECGDHIVASSSIYGGTFNLIAVTMAKMGITATFVSPDATEEELNAAFRPNTKLMFGETIANPALTVLDIELFAKGGTRARSTAYSGQYLPDTCKLGLTEAQAYAVVWDAFQKIQEEAPRAMVYYGQETGLKKENPDKPYDEIGILLPIREFEKKMLQHLDEIDGIVLACREKMMEKAGNDSLQL